jgi:ParB-like chromosome segregation protein Spo0J
MGKPKYITEIVNIKEVKNNPNNPRLIKDDKFKKLVQSIKNFPEMLNIRPIVVNEDMVILGGNMRYKACLEAGIKEIPVIKTKLTEQQQREFIIKDNISGGEWDWDILANEWESEELEEWGIDVWKAPVEVDYSILDEEDVSEQLKEMTDGVKKAIQIEFEAEHYDEAYALVKFWREKEAYVGGMIMEYLKAEKEKI